MPTSSFIARSTEDRFLSRPASVLLDGIRAPDEFP
jgi:hypothetical protein